MNSYTIIKVLALCLGAVSVVGRTLPEQRSGINARAARGYGLSNTATNQDSVDAKIEVPRFSAATGEHFDISTPSYWLLLSFISILTMFTIMWRSYQMSTTQNSTSREWAM